MAVVSSTTYLYVDANLTQFFIQGASLIDRGAWSSSAFYNPSDVVQIGIDQYIALVTNSNTPPTGIVDDNWSTLVIVEEAGTITGSGSDWYTRQLAELALETAWVGTQIGSSAYNYANSAYYLATSGTNIAWAAYYLAQIGTNTGTAAYTLATSGSNLAWQAYLLSQEGTNTPDHNDLNGLQGGATNQFYHVTGTTYDALIGAATPSSSNVYITASVLAFQMGTANANLITEQGTRSQEDQYLQNQITALQFSSGSGADLAAAAYALAQIGTNTGTAALNAAAAAQSTANSAFTIAVIGTNTGTAAYNLAAAAYALAQIGTNTGTAALAAAATAQSTADSAFTIAVIGTNLAAAAYALAQIGTNTGTAALAAAATAQSTANSAFTIAVIGTNTGTAAYNLAQAAYALAQIGTNTGTAALAAAATAQSTANSAFTIAVIGTNTGTAAYNLATSAYTLATTGTNKQFGITVGDGATVISTGTKGWVRVPQTMNVTGWEIVASDGLAGSIVMDAWKTTYSSLPPTVSNTVFSGNKPTLVGTVKAQNTALYIPITEGDYVGFNVDSVSTSTRVHLAMFGTTHN